MRKKNLLALFVLIGSCNLSLGQNHEVIFQITPSYGNYARLYGDGGFSQFVGFVPVAAASIGVQSKSRLFYQIFLGAQLGLTQFKKLGNFYTYDDYLPIYPSASMSLGYAISAKNNIIAQSSLWSYSISYQRDWKYVAIGISAGRMFDGLTEKLDNLRIGPNVSFYPWFRFSYEQLSNYLLSANLNLNVTTLIQHKIDSSHEKSPTISKGIPKEF